MTHLYDDNDGLTLPKDEAEYQERRQRAREFLARHPVNFDVELEDVFGFCPKRQTV